MFGINYIDHHQIFIINQYLTHFDAFSLLKNSYLWLMKKSVLFFFFSIKGSTAGNEGNYQYIVMATFMKDE